MSSLGHFLRHFSVRSSFRFSTALSRRSVSVPPPISPLASLFSNFKSSHQTSVPNSSVADTSVPSNGHNSLRASDSFSSSPYLSVRICCRKDVADTLSEALLCFGASSTSVDEHEDCEISDEIYIDTIFPVDHNVKACISQAVASAGLQEMPVYDIKAGEQYDWIKKTQESFYPVEVTERLWIVPEWRKPVEAHATNIILNPGLAFGTGEHPTTRSCLLLLKQVVKGGEVILDYGTGSGILAIAALKFGASLSVGIDIDPQAITAALHNAALNKIQPEKMQLHLVPGQTTPTSRLTEDHKIPEHQASWDPAAEKDKYDLVIANILMNPLLELAGEIVSYAKPGAVVALSGILSEQLQSILDQYSTFLDCISVSELDGWVCMSGMKKVSTVG